MSKSKTKHHKKESGNGKQGKAEHKKEKPKKERKQKGIKQKQSQKQKQVVNIKIGGDSGGNNDRSNKMPIPLPMPNITFNPSLSVIPNALLNKPETNPPFYAEQAGGLVGGAVPQIPNFNIPSFEPPIREQPININKKPPPISVPLDIITGNGEKIKQPPEVYQPIPQDEVSKPKEQIPELYIGEEKIKTKHDLHKESKTKIKDTEGLGANIPISKIGEIAATIGSGALTGGATMLGEAALTGGLGAITAEGIASSLIGGGVGAGVSSALGGGPVSHIVGGIAGGIASREVVKNVRQRQKREQQNIRETEPLLGGTDSPTLTQDGQRLGGGRSGFNRLTGEPMSQTETTETTKTRTRQIKDSLESIKNKAKLKMEDLAANIGHYSNKLLGDKKGTYARLPTTEESMQTEPSLNPFNPQLNQKLRGYKGAKYSLSDPEPVSKSYKPLGKTDQEYIDSQVAKFERNLKRVKEGDGAIQPIKPKYDVARTPEEQLQLEQMRKERTEELKRQTLQRDTETPFKTMRKHWEGEEMANAATKIQTVIRGKQAKQQALKRVKEIKKAGLEAEVKKGIEQLNQLQAKANEMKQLRDNTQALENQLIQQNQTRGQKLTYRNKKQLEQQIAGVKDEAILKIQNAIRGRKARIKTGNILENKMKQERMKPIINEIINNAVESSAAAQAIRNEKINDEAAATLQGTIKRRQIQNKVNPLLEKRQVRKTAAIKIQSAVRGRQAKKEMRNRIINEASRENQMQAAANRFNTIGEQMLNRAERQTNIYGGEFIQQRARDRMKRAQTIVSNLDTRSYRNPREDPEITRQRANQTIQRLQNIIVRRGPQGRPATRSGQQQTTDNQSIQSMASTIMGAAYTPKKK